jgi:hypothetical protein
LWAMMALMVRLFSDRKKQPEAENTRAGSTGELENKRLAAAIAVSTAIEMHNTSIQVSGHKERESISAWQAAHRSRQLNQNHSISSRKH